MNEVADLVKEYIASKDKLSVVVARQEKYAQRMKDEGYSPCNNPLSESIIELLQSIDDCAIELLSYQAELDVGLVNDSMLHIHSCVSNIRVKLGLPPTSFSKAV